VLFCSYEIGGKGGLEFGLAQERNQVFLVVTDRLEHGVTRRDEFDYQAFGDDS